MRKYKFLAKDKTSRRVRGMVEASDVKSAVGVIRAKGLLVVKLREAKPNLFTQINDFLFKRVGLTEISTFTRQLSTMTTAGLQLTESLGLLQAQSSKGMSEVISAIQTDVSGGMSLGEALAKHPRIFSKVYVSLIKAGETAGALDDILLRLADNLEKQREFMAKVKGAMIYPVVVVTGMLLVAAIMMIFVVPKLTSIYTDFDAKLPAATVALITVSNVMSRYWPIFLVLIAGLIYLITRYAQTRGGRRRFDELKLKIPVIGPLMKEVVLTEFGRTLSLLIGAGVPIIDALNVVSDSAGNVIYEESLRQSAKQVEKGFTLAFTMVSNPIYPAIVPQMVSVGEETGKMDEVLSKLAHYFETESEQKVKGLTTAIEPIIMIVLGLGVGFLVIAVIMPIYNLTSAF